MRLRDFLLYIKRWVLFRGGSETYNNDTTEPLRSEPPHFEIGCFGLFKFIIFFIRFRLISYGPGAGLREAGVAEGSPPESHDGSGAVNQSPPEIRRVSCYCASYEGGLLGEHQPTENEGGVEVAVESKEVRRYEERGETWAQRAHREVAELLRREERKKRKPRRVYLKFPGWGERTYSTCGLIRSILKCPRCGRKHKAVRLKCYRDECPVCFREKAKRDAWRITERITEYARLTWKWKEWKHIILSPPQKEAKELMKTDVGIDKLFKTAVKLLKKYGLEGGVIIFHHKRKKRGRRGRRSYWRTGPHFHIYGYGRLIKSSEFYEKTNWVYKNAKRGRKLWGLIYYLLTHKCCICDENNNVIKKSVRWFGSLALNKMRRVAVERRTVRLYCKKCAEEGEEVALHKYDPVTGEDYGVFEFVVESYRYKLNKPPPNYRKLIEDDGDGG